MHPFIRTCLLGLVSLLPMASHAASFPEKPIRMVVPFAAGGNVDIVARLVAEKLGAELGQSIVIENLPGASGAIGTAAVARAAPDGHTLLAQSSAHVILPSVRGKLGYDVAKDFVALSQLTEVPMIMVVSGSIPATNHQEFVAWAKAQKNPIQYATFPGTAGHVAGEAWKEATGVPVEAIPYKSGTTAIADVAAGRLPVQFDALLSGVSTLKIGKSRGLAITGSTRSPMLPDVPTFAELGFPNVDATTWHGFWAPKGTPQAVVDRLGAALVKISKMKDIQERIHAMGGKIVGSNPVEFSAFTTKERERWAALLKRAGVQPEM